MLEEGPGRRRSEPGGGEREGEGQTQRRPAASSGSQALPFLAGGVFSKTRSLDFRAERKYL